MKLLLSWTALGLVFLFTNALFGQVPPAQPAQMAPPAVSSPSVPPTMAPPAVSSPAVPPTMAPPAPTQTPPAAPVEKKPEIPPKLSFTLKVRTSTYFNSEIILNQQTFRTYEKLAEATQEEILMDEKLRVGINLISVCHTYIAEETATKPTARQLSITELFKKSSDAEKLELRPIFRNVSYFAKEFEAGKRICKDYRFSLMTGELVSEETPIATPTPTPTPTPAPTPTPTPVVHQKEMFPDKVGKKGKLINPKREHTQLQNVEPGATPDISFGKNNSQDGFMGAVQDSIPMFKFNKSSQQGGQPVGLLQQLPMLLGGTLAFGIMGGLVFLTLLMIASMWVVFTKAGESGVLSLIPFLNVYIMLKIAGKPGWHILLFLVPIANLIVPLMMTHGIAENFGRGLGFTIGLIFFPWLFWPILAFSSAKYLGPGNRAYMG